MPPARPHDLASTPVSTDYADLKIVDRLNAEEYGVAFRRRMMLPPLWMRAFDY